MDLIEPQGAAFSRLARAGTLVVYELPQDDPLHVEVCTGAPLTEGEPGAWNIAPGELTRRLGELPRNREIVAYCRGPYCLYSVEAVVELRRRGFRARRLSGGLPDWRARGYSVKTGPA